MVSTLCFAILFQAMLFEPFPDVPPHHWASKAVNELKELGLLKGYPGGRFRG